MSTELERMQLMERIARARATGGIGRNDAAELLADLREAAKGYQREQRSRPRPAPEWAKAAGLRPGIVNCDCICNCGTIVQVVRQPVKGTEDTLCMTCLELSRRNDPTHRPWPADGVVILPPEKKS